MAGLHPGTAGQAGAFSRPSRTGGYLIALVLLAGLPFVLDTPYWRGILVVCAMNVLLALALNLVLGYTGQLNLGQSAFFAIGAYVSTVLVKSHGWNFWLAMVAAVAASGVVGLLLAAFAVRLRGHYLGIASLGFAVITYQVLVNWESVTEGVRGIYGIMPPPAIHLPGLPELSFGNSLTLFWLVGGLAFLVYLMLDNLLRSPVGEALRALREDEVSAASLGIHGARWKAFAFGLGSAIAGLAGCFYPGFVGTLVPDAFNIVESFTMMAMVIVGGMGTMIGPVIGAVTLTFLPELLRSAGELRLLVYGLALTLVVLFMPGGLVQLGQWLRARLLRGKSAGGRP
jgi:branched-chain amino acid transport system permease protein